MKKLSLIILLFVISFLINVASAHAAPPTPSPTPEDSEAEIRDRLITNIASRVAQLKLVEKRGIVGTVSDVTNTQVTLTDQQGNTRFVDVDELTKFSDPSAKGSFGISDIEKGATVGVLGLYNKESRRILARFINVTTTSVIIHGGVSAIDNKNYTLNVATEDGKQMTVDVETLTRTYTYTQKDGYVKSGFSKIKENSNIIVSGVLDKKDKSRIIATRIIFFAEIPPNPKVNSPLNQTTKTK